jgi:DNA ligase-1
MYELLGELFRKADEAEVGQLAYLCQAQLLPAFEGVEMGMGERLVASAIAASAKKNQADVFKLYKKTGDLGLVAESLLPEKKRSALTVSKAYSSLLEIARTAGSGSVEKKIQMLARLLNSASSRSARFLVRFAVGRLRLGLGVPTIIEAIARTYPETPEARASIERAYNLCSDLGLVIGELRKHGFRSLEKFRVRVGNPVKMMLAERARDAEEIIRKIGRCAVESKLDGFRCQVHLKGKKVEIFSRNIERMTDTFPDVSAAVRTGTAARSVIIEGEAVAFNEATGEFYPFQVTVQRKRKHDIEEMAQAWPLALIVFDLLFANGKDYTTAGYETRRKKLESIIRTSERLRLVEGIVTDEATRIERFFDEQIERGFEGIIAKRLDAPYQAGVRNFNWIKLKRTYSSKLSDTVDAVVVGYLRGRGMRARLRIGALLVAVYDKRSDTFQTIAKVGSGLSEEGWIKLRRLLDKEASKSKPARVDARLVPDVWVKPKYVVTILADEITRSPVHTAAKNEKGAGLSLRFPRVVGFIREDKTAEDATTVKEIKEMSRMKKSRR